MPDVAGRIDAAPAAHDSAGRRRSRPGAGDGAHRDAIAGDVAAPRPPTPTDRHRRRHRMRVTPTGRSSRATDRRRRTRGRARTSEPSIGDGGRGTPLQREPGDDIRRARSPTRVSDEACPDQRDQPGGAGVIRQVRPQSGGRLHQHIGRARPPARPTGRSGTPTPPIPARTRPPQAVTGPLRTASPRTISGATSRLPAGSPPFCSATTRAHRERAEQRPTDAVEPDRPPGRCRRAGSRAACAAANASASGISTVSVSPTVNRPRRPIRSRPAARRPATGRPRRPGHLRPARRTSITGSRCGCANRCGTAQRPIRRRRRQHRRAAPSARPRRRCAGPRPATARPAPRVPVAGMLDGPVRTDDEASWPGNVGRSTPAQWSCPQAADVARAYGHLMRDLTVPLRFVRAGTRGLSDRLGSAARTR